VSAGAVGMAISSGTFQSGNRGYSDGFAPSVTENTDVGKPVFLFVLVIASKLSLKNGVIALSVPRHQRISFPVSHCHL